MANKTITGHIEEVEGKWKVVFDGEACDSGDYTGKMVWTGVHAGQVAVTVDELNCDDIYYGDIPDECPWTFEVEIPDNCCGLSNCSSCPAIYSTSEWTPCCFEEGEVPKYLCCEFTGIKRCSDDSTIPNTYVCVEGDGVVGWHRYFGTFSDGEASYTVELDWSGGSADSMGGVYTGERAGGGTILFHLQIGGYCSGGESWLVRDDCGDPYWEWAGKTAVGYEGFISVYNPFTGDEVQSC